MMRRFFFLIGLAFWFSSCSNSGSGNTATDSPGTEVMTDTNNASKNTGTDMSGGVNSGNLNNGDTTGIDINADTTHQQH
jgi:hypothetical protein